MQISPIGNNENCTFKAYKITPKGAAALKKITNIEEKQAIIDCCEYFKGYKYAHVLVDTFSSGEVNISLRIPDSPYWMYDFHSTYSSPKYNDRGIYISPYYIGLSEKDIFVDLNGKAQDSFQINGRAGKTLSLFREFNNQSCGIFEKIEKFKRLGYEVESARISMEGSKQMDSEIDELIANQNL